MLKYRKLIAFTLCIMLFAGVFTGCTGQYTRRIAIPNNRYNNLDKTMDDNMNQNYSQIGTKNDTLNGRSNINYTKRISASFEKADISYGKLTVPNLTIRSGPGTNFTKIGNVSSNDKLNVYGKTDGWYIVQIPGQKNIGCVDSKYVQPYPSGTAVKRIPNVPPPVNAGTTTPGTTVPGATGRVPGGPNPPTNPINIGPGSNMSPRTGTPGTATPGVQKPSTTAPSAPTQDAAGTGVMTAEERRILELCNAERAKVGAPALKANNDLTKLARMKSKDMIDKDYFAHQSPTYGSPFDMMRNHGISYMYAGENLAQNTTADKAFQAWMNSEGHKKNIMNPQFTELGVGIASMDGSNMYTQMFIGK